MRSTTARPGALGVLAAGALAAAALAGGTPQAAATPPNCTASHLANTASGVLNQAGGFLEAHPEANDVITAAANQPPEEARSAVRGYFTAHPGEFLELQGIARPLTDMRNQCGVNLTPSQLALLIDTIAD